MHNFEATEWWAMVTALFLYAPTIYFVARFMFFNEVKWTNAERILFIIAILLVVLAAMKQMQLQQ